MQFRLSTLFLLFVVLWSSLAVFGGWGIGVFVFLVLLAIGIAGRTWLLLVLLTLVVLIALLLPAVSAAREAARRIACNNQLKQIGIALYNYHVANGCFPPAYIADKNGKPMHSWRVLILPFLDDAPLYNAYNFNEPWDGPNNKKLLASRPYGYACPSDKNAYSQGATFTSYVAVVGANAAWTGATPGNPAGDPSKTIMLVEVADAGIQWSEPKDVSLDALLAGTPGSVKVSSKHFREHEFFTYTPRAGVNVALADGSVCFLPGGLLDSDKFPDLLKVGGFRKEYLEADWADVGRRIHWTNCTAFAVWLASSGWLLVRAVRSRKKPSELAVEKSQDQDQRRSDAGASE
jgi:hypothetical protein